MPLKDREARLEYERKRYARNRERIRAQQKDYYDSQPEEWRGCRTAAGRVSYHKCKGNGKRAASARSWMEQKLQDDPSYQRRAVAKCRANDPGWRSKDNAWAAKRRAGILKRTPEYADMEAIRFFYECCPRGCHVDHVIPLKGEIVSGFHVETNLQWLPAAQNIAKSNSYVVL